MTTTKLWQIDDDELHPLVEHYTVGNDRSCDQTLLGYDITATKAHAHMLSSISILSRDEYKQIADTLDALYDKWQKGTFVVTSEDEDGHTAIEKYLTAKLGPIGKKVHTGRSRNDQALVMMRLYLKDQLSAISAEVTTLCDAYDQAIAAAGSQAMPGYTHTQKAMPTTVALWLGSYRDAFADTLPYLTNTLALIDQNPLGSAAGFGIELPLDREMTTKELSFAKVQDNPLYCGLSRGVFELITIQAFVPFMVFAGKFAEDMLLFTSQEFNFFSLPKSMTTGSSIMPHKRNYDVFEIMRATAHSYSGHITKLHAITAGVGSGYHRDLQLTKAITIEACQSAKQTLEVLTLCVRNLMLNTKHLDAAMTDELYTVAKINKRVAEGMAFRDAYVEVKRTLQ